MMPAVQVMQTLVVALILLVACAAKLVRVLRGGSVRVGQGESGLFPAGFRRPATLALCCCELLLGVGLIVTAGRFGAGLLASGTRLAAGVFFLIGMRALVELRERRPGAGCGCFGELSTRPVSVRSIVRAGMLACAALGSVGTPPLRLPPPGHTALADAGIIVAELLLFAAVSPETREALLRLGYSEPCELRVLEEERVLSALRHSAAWRRYSAMLTAGVAEDTWRELCWWFAVYPADDGGRERRVVFAVEVKPYRPAVLAVVTEPAADEQPLSLSNAL
jgi:Methylamine utilisation protein MauE